LLGKDFKLISSYILIQQNKKLIILNVLLANECEKKE